MVMTKMECFIKLQERSSVKSGTQSEIVISNPDLSLSHLHAQHRELQRYMMWCALHLDLIEGRLLNITLQASFRALITLSQFRDEKPNFGGKYRAVNERFKRGKDTWNSRR